MAMNNPDNGSSWGRCGRKRSVGELEAGAQGGVHLMLHNTEGPTCGICISIDLGRVCGTAVYPHL